MHKLLIVIFLWIPACLFAQTKIDWYDLSDVSYKQVYNEDFGTYDKAPKFGEKVRKLEGEQVILKGFILPMDVKGEHYVLSMHPYNTCYFCASGEGVGMQTVVDLYLKGKNRRYEMDEVVTFQGTLRLNEEIYGLSYKLEDAKEWKK